MNTEQFWSFIQHHKIRYPGLDEFFKRTPGQPSVWNDMLGDFDLEELKQASDDLNRSEEQPRGYADHPRTLRAIVKRNRAERERQTQPINVDTQDPAPRTWDYVKSGAVVHGRNKREYGMGEAFTWITNRMDQLRAEGYTDVNAMAKQATRELLDHDRLPQGETDGSV